MDIAEKRISKLDDMSVEMPTTEMLTSKKKGALNIQLWDNLKRCNIHNWNTRRRISIEKGNIWSNNYKDYLKFNDKYITTNPGSSSNLTLQNKYQHFCTWVYHIKLKNIEEKDKILKVGSQKGMRLLIGIRIALNISIKPTSERVEWNI